MSNRGRRRSRSAAFVLALALAAGLPAGATVIIDIPDTGVDLNRDGIDDNYILTFSSLLGGFTGPAYVAEFEGEIAPSPGGQWMTGPSSRWIAPANLRDGDAFAPGVYRYTVTFSLGLVDLDRTSIVGLWAADGRGIDIWVNDRATGRSTQNPTAGTLVGSYTEFTAFVILHSDCVGGCFVPGTNTLSFVVHNGADETGLRAELYARVEDVPEPASLSLAGAGLLLAALLRRRYAR